MTADPRTSQIAADEAAAAWDARLRSADATQRDHQAFQAWLAEDAEHQHAYDRLQAALRLLRRHADLPELSALRDEARSAVRAGKQRRLVAMLSVAAAVAGVLALAAVPWTERGNIMVAERAAETLYTTQPFEQTRVTLADGSLVTLDSDTQLAVRLSDHRRDVTLRSGRALFKVAKDSERPFMVHAGDRTITALGTVFDVRVSPREMRVTLAEGMVAVRPVSAGLRAPLHVLKPRQQLVALVGNPSAELRTVDIQNALAWADRQFFFEDEPLVSAIDEINRYGDLEMIVDPSAASLRISGMFRVSNEAAFVEALKLALPVDVQKDAKGRLVVTRSAATSVPDTRVAVM